ncbi:MAG: hypothetical protein ACXIVQ_11515 [Acidimicrobiales bacterium]
MLSDDAWVRARDYPYDRPSGSFLFDPDTGVRPLTAPPEACTDGRTAVLAVGSNAAPTQLARKFAGSGAPGGFAVVAVSVSDHDSVFAAMVAGYGSVPATLAPSPGTQCHLHVTLLDGAQLERMNETESVGVAYDLVKVRAAVAWPDGWEAPGPLLAYVARTGVATVGGDPVALAAIPADRRRHDAWSEEQMLAHAGGLVGLGPRELVAACIADAGLRREVGAALALGRVVSGDRVVGDGWS